MSTPSHAPPRTFHQRIDAGASALLVIDMQNDFCAAGGYIDRIVGKDVAGFVHVVPRVQSLIDSARSANVPVIWVRADYSHERIPYSMRVRLEAAGIVVQCCVPSTWGAQWFGVEPLATEQVITKHTYSAFTRAELHEHLQGLGLKTLVFTGVQTHVCVESSVRDAHSLGYLCVVASDAVSSYSPSLHDSSLSTMGSLFADTCASADIVAAWARH